jgi:integrase
LLAFVCYKSNGENQRREVVHGRRIEMANGNSSTAMVIPFPVSNQDIKQKSRKHGLNSNKDGSVRKINGKVYVDFVYLDERVREPSGLVWNYKNAKYVRNQLDKIVVAIKSGTFRYAKVFPDSKRAGHFIEKERALCGGNKTPDEVLVKDHIWIWYNLLKGSGRVTGRTLGGYKSNIDLYLLPFFGDMSFANLNVFVFDEFISWARKRKYRGKPIGNETINKVFIPFKMICRSAAIKYGWGGTYNPFFGFKRLPEGDPIEKIFPFSSEEQLTLTTAITDHWKPYFRSAFAIGLREGEQIGLKPHDIDWAKKLLHVRRAITLDEDGKKIEGRTKNRYSRRTIKLIPVMFDALKAQKDVHDRCGGEYFFCTPKGNPVCPSNLRLRVWIPALKEAGLEYREMKQTRHSFATVALSCGESPLWIAKVMGHRNTEMVIKVYSKYIENAGRSTDGALLNEILQGNESGKEEE